MQTYKIVSIILLVGVFSCKDSASSTAIADSDTNTINIDSSFALYNQSEVTREDIENMRNQVNPILTTRQESGNKKPATIIEKDKWIFEAVLKNSTMMLADSMGNPWIDFNDDFTYLYGKGESKQGTGSYHYDIEKSQLLMVDHNQLLKPQEFEVKMANDAMVLIGMPIYRDNNIQTKLVRKSND